MKKKIAAQYSKKKKWELSLPRENYTLQEHDTESKVKPVISNAPSRLTTYGLRVTSTTAHSNAQRYYDGFLEVRKSQKNFASTVDAREARPRWRDRLPFCKFFIKRLRGALIYEPLKA